MPLPFRIESWIWYSVGVALTVARLISRSLLLGSVKRLQLDDWLIIFVLIPYTAFIVTINQVVHYNSNLLAPGENVSNFTPEEVDSRIYGSKLTVVVEEMQCITIWSLKICLLLMYYRLTQGFRTHIVVIGLFVYVISTFILMEILYLGVWCRPFHNYWALPTPSKQCNAAINHLIVNAVFNLSSDLVMLGVAFSLFIRTSLAWSRKIILCCIFGLGIFVVLCAILNKYYSFSHPFGSQWTYWYVRESSTTLLVANIPFTWTILRRVFKLPAFHDHIEDSKTVSYHSQRAAHGRHRAHRRTTSGSGTKNFTTAGGSNQTSSGDHPPSPIEIRHPSILVERNLQPTWRDRGFYGRAELDALSIDPDDEAEVATVSNIDEQVNPETATIRSHHTAGSAQPDNPRSSPGSGHSSPSSRRRRLRDEEAQYEIQERVSPTYAEFTFTTTDYDEEEERRRRRETM